MIKISTLFSPARAPAPGLKFIIALGLYSVLGCFGSVAFSADKTPGSTLVWDLSELYPNINAWEQARTATTARIKQLKHCRGELGRNAQILGKCLQLSSDIYRSLLRVYTYSFLEKDIDLGNSEARQRHNLSEELLSQYEQSSSFIEPELLKIDKIKLRKWQKQSQALNDFDFFIRNLLRNEPHILSAPEERILAAANAPLRAASTTYSILSNAEIPPAEITLGSGEQVKLTATNYAKYRGSADRSERKAVFDAFFGNLTNYQQSLASTLTGQVQAQIFEARMRRYPSALARSLAVDNIPEPVYRALVDTVNDNLDTLHRYLRLRARLMGIKEPRYYDVYPDVIDLDRQYSIEQSQELLTQALEPLGETYLDMYKAASRKPWMHVPPAEGKRSGAYAMSAAYDVHPYVLLNHNNDFDSLSTYAHEWGHVMHSLLTQQNQPFSKAEYATFIAEIASIAHELLLYKHLAENAANRDEKLFYLIEELQGLRGTFFRQTQFAEFELAIHKEVENGGALSADRLNEIYGETLKRYYGHNAGIMTIDDTYAIEWAYIPHFYRNFYVYQYATSISAAYYLMDKVLSGGERERRQYLSILEAGGSDYPYDILKKAGADMASPLIYQAVIKRCNMLMDEIELLLAPGAYQ
ncbi:MAG TPA: oligoendopeptidase F [Porticoccaceae bacterium]|nr:oligoendopeptidase F [Porticoccaceae bacterium]